MNVLILCHGNINRSPAAEIILNDMAIPGVIVRSAGFRTSGRVTAKKMREALALCGYKRTATRSTQVSAELITWADLILTMDGGNEERLASHFGEEAMRKTKRISSAILLSRIPDPHFSVGNSAHVEVIHMLQRAFATIVFREWLVSVSMKEG